MEIRSGKSIRIEQIANQRELLGRLINGEKVIAYHGSKRYKGPLATGKVLDRPYGKSNDLKYSTKEEVLEEMRAAQFPRMPSRLGSVFAAPSTVEAGKWGEIYEVEIGIKPELLETFRAKAGLPLPVCWLSYKAYEYIHNLIATDMDIDSDLLSLAREYWTSVGSSYYSEILVDPKFVNMKVLGKYAAQPEKFLAEFLERMMVYFHPHTMLLVDEHLKDFVHDPVFKYYDKKYIRKAAARRLIAERIKAAKVEIAAVLKGNARLTVDVDEKVTIHPPQWVEEAVRDAGLDITDREDWIIMGRFKRFNRTLTKVAPHLILKGMEFRASNETKLQANGQCVSELSMRIEAAHYGRACKLAGIKPDKIKLTRILREWGINTKIRMLQEIATGKYSFYYDKEAWTANLLVSMKYAGAKPSEEEMAQIININEQVLRKLEMAKGLGPAYNYLVKKYDRLRALCERLLRDQR